MTTPRSIAARIKAATREPGKSITWLSGETGIAEKTLRRRLVAPDAFTLAELASVSRALDTELEDLLKVEVAA